MNLYKVFLRMYNETNDKQHKLALLKKWNVVFFDKVQNPL